MGGACTIYGNRRKHEKNTLWGKIKSSCSELFMLLRHPDWRCQIGCHMSNLERVSARDIYLRTITIWVVVRATGLERTTTKESTSGKGTGRLQTKCTVGNGKKELTLVNSVSGTSSTSPSTKHNPGRQKLLLPQPERRKSNPGSSDAHYARVFLWQGFSKSTIWLGTPVPSCWALTCTAPGSLQDETAAALLCSISFEHNTSLLAMRKHAT